MKDVKISEDKIYDINELEWLHANSRIDPNDDWLTLKDHIHIVKDLQKQIDSFKNPKMVTLEDLRLQFDNIYKMLVGLPWDTTKEVEQLWSTYKCCAETNGIIKPLVKENI